MIPEDLRNEFKALSGDNWINSQGEPDIDYVSWLEKKLIKNHGVSHHVSESKPFDIHNCINEILQDVDRYRYSAMRFVNDGRIRYQVKRAIDKMIYSR